MATGKIESSIAFSNCYSNDVTVNSYEGYYTKVGKLVTFALQMNVTCSGSGSAVGIYVVGLPDSQYDYEKVSCKIDTETDISAQKRASNRIRISNFPSGTHDVSVFGTYICQ